MVLVVMLLLVMLLLLAVSRSWEGGGNVNGKR